MTNYRKGAQFEYRVREFFRNSGFAAERKAASAPYDIIVMRDGRIHFLIDAKKTSQKNRKYIYISKEDIDKIIKESAKLGATPLIVWGFQRTPIYYEKAHDIIDKIEGKNYRLEEGNLLETLLSTVG